MRGNITHGSAPCGAIAGIISEIIPAREVIQRMVEGYQSTIAK
jgi:NAD(P)H-dependent flavin oxidoreductase YrpB (nitropropane dioxygenase family)